MKTVHEFLVFADNFQFQIQDQKEECEFPEEWNDRLLTQMYAAGERVIGICTVRDLDVEVSIVIHSDKMDEKDVHKIPDLTEYDHVAQCNLELPSGAFILTGCTEFYDDANKIRVEPGQYGVRIFWSNLDSIDELGFEGDDRYIIEMWPDTQFEPQVLKAWRQLAYQINPQNN